MSPVTDPLPWVSRDPSELTTQALLGDLLGYDDGYAGRGLRAAGAEEAIVERWIRTPRGRELAVRLTHGQAALALDPDPLYIGPSADYVEGYDAGFGDARVAGDRDARRAFTAGLILGGTIFLLGLVFLAVAAPRSGQTTVDPGARGGTTAGAGDTARAAVVSSAGQSGAPQMVAGFVLFETGGAP